MSKLEQQAQEIDRRFEALSARKADLQETLKWLRDKTPVTSYFQQPRSMPEYGVLAEWGLGAYVDYVAERVIETVKKLRELSPLYEMAREGVDLKTVAWPVER